MQKFPWRLTALEDRIQPVGGGFANLVGEYFNNDALAGSPAFSRGDNRIDFDWGTALTPGGSSSPGYRDLTSDSFSARWSGQLLPAFSETYTFHVTADDGVRLFVNGTPVIDQWTASGSFTGTYAFQAGQTYNITVEYREATGAAAISVSWSSPSTPLEVIEAPSAAGYNITNRESFIFADAMKNARANWNGINNGVPPGTDANGWPLADGEMIVWEGAGDFYFSGTYAARFTGQANVSGTPGGTNNIRYRIPGNPTLFDNLTPAQIWNSGTNVSQFEIVVPNHAGNSPYTLRLQNTRRIATDVSPTGVTSVEVMRPQTIGGNNPYPFGTLFRDNFKEAASVFTSYRWLDLNGDLSENEWSQRTSPAWARASSPRPDGIVHKDWTYEYQILFANETGKDLYITVPMRASNDYFQNLARLLRYGSRADGTVCTSDDDPLRAYPGLNPNLRAYVELSNEVWNGSAPFGQTRQADDDAVAAGLAPVGSALRAEWDIVNYDGALDTNDASGYGSFNFRRLGRWYALRALRMSEEMRTVFGDDHGERVRPLLYWQYNNANNTALNELKFLDDYFNNGGGNFVAAPQPVSHFFWGGGGASYYASNNSQGRLEADPITNASFDVTQGLPLNEATPRPNSVTDWNFSGNAGVIGRAPVNGSNFTADGRTLTGVANPSIGDYAAYLMRSQGADPASMISRTIHFDQPGRYAIGFTLRYRNGFQYNVPLDFTLDGARVTPQYLPYRGVGEASAAAGPSRVSYSFNINPEAVWSSQLTTATLQIDVPAGGRDVIFTVSAAPVVLGQFDTAQQQEAYALFDNFYVASVDRVFAAGLPNTGQANGQVGTGDWSRDRNQIAQYAQAYGLVATSYESGYSLGGDGGSSPLQNWIKYNDPRTKLANDEAIDVHSRAGYGLVAYGVYEQWRDYNLVNAASAPLRQSFDGKNQSLPAGPTNGQAVPFVLRAAQQSFGYTGSGVNWSYSRTADANLSASEFLSWNIIAPVSGLYAVDAVTAAGGTARVTLDETEIASGTSGAALAANVYLTKGLHTLKVRSTSGTFAVDRVQVTVVGSPTATTLSAPVEVNGQVRLTWAAVPGATGYHILYGTAPNTYSQTVPAGDVTTFDVAGLAAHQAYYFAVAAVNASGPSLPSNEQTSILLPEGAPGNLAVWEFTGKLGGEADALVSVATSRVVVSPLSRGPGMIPSSGWVPQFFPNRFSSFSSNTVWAQDLADSVVQGQYYQFSVAAAAGQAMSLSTLNVSAWFSHADADNGAGISWSTDGAAFTPLAITGTATTGYTADLSGVPQNSTGTVTFRVYVFGAGNFQATGLGFGTAANDVAVVGSAKTIPAVTSVAVDDGSAQRSRVTSLTVTFNTAVDLGTAAFDLRPQAGGAAVQLTWTTADVNGRTIATITFPALADSRWRLTTVASQVAHRLGGVLMAADAASDFHRFYGDIDGNAVVDSGDFAFFGNVFGLTVDSPFDFDGNGAIDGPTDFAAFGGRFGVTL